MYTKLRKYQSEAIEISVEKNGYGYFFDRGTGKTIVALRIAQLKANQGNVLVVTKDDLIKDNLLQEMKNWENSEYHFAKLNYAILTGSRQMFVTQKKIFDSNCIPVEFKPKVYFASFTAFRDTWDAICKNITTVIVDESGLLRNVWSKLSLAFRHAKDKYNFKNIYLFSGLPAPNAEIEYFTQLYLIAPDLFGRSFEKYKEDNFRIAKKNELNAGKYVLKNPDEFKEKLKTVSWYINRNDIFDQIPPVIYLKKYFDLTNEQKVYYDVIITQTKKYIREHSGEAIEVLIPFIVKQIRWLQVICGHYVSEDGATIELKSNLYDAMWDEIKDINESVLIWCNYDYEQINVVNYLINKGRSVGFVHGGQKPAERRMARQAFKNKKVQYLVLKPRANAHGHNFQHVCNFAVYTTLSYSLDDSEQSIDRIFRPPYTKACTVLNMIARDTIMEVIYNAVQNKRSAAMDVLNYLKAN